MRRRAVSTAGGPAVDSEGETTSWQLVFGAGFQAGGATRSSRRADRLTRRHSLQLEFLGDRRLLAVDLQWAMEPILKPDVDGRYSVPNSWDHAHPSSFEVRIDVSQSLIADGTTPTTFELDIPNATSVIPAGTGLFVAQLPEGASQATVTVYNVTSPCPSGSLTDTFTLDVDNIVVASFGDSFTSGEGAPDERVTTPASFLAVWASLKLA